MEKCACSSCNKLFFYDPKLVPYRTIDSVLSQKIMECPYCNTEHIVVEYDEEMY